MMLKEKIAELLLMGLSSRAIAEQVGCHEGYVRVVKQRIQRGGLRPSDRVDMQRRRDDYYSVPQAERQRIHREEMRAGRHSLAAIYAAGRKLRRTREAERETTGLAGS